LVFGDTIPVTFRALTPRPGGGQANPWQDADLTGQSVRVAIGVTGGKPSSGTFTLTYDGDETSALAYNASAAQVQTALNALDSIDSAGDVTVSAPATGIYRIVFDAVGSRTAITSNCGSLYPSSGAAINVAQEGSGSAQEVIVIRLETMPAAYAELSTSLPAATVTVDTVRAGDTGIGSIQTVTLSEEAIGGVFTLALDGDETAAIAYNAAPADVKAALEALDDIGEGNVTVSGAAPQFYLTFAASLGALDELTADDAGLISATGRSGTLSLNTAGIVELLAGRGTASAQFEVELYDSGEDTAWTAIQAACTVREDIIPGNPVTQGQLPDPAAWLEAQLLSLREITLSVDNGSGAAVTFGGVVCPDGDGTLIGTVDPLSITYVAASGGTITSLADDVGLDIGFSGCNLGASGTIALPAPTRGGGSYTLYIGGA
jgi:hypothetical protein